MTPERWQQIDQLFHEALACDAGKRAAFLDKACAGDEPLRAEIESLISSHDESQSFIETPAGDVAAELIGTHQSTFSTGAEIGNYRIVGHLGSGGMGEVYLADDTRLNRKVALKLLPPHFTINPDRVRRFEREARAASALNHPNIVTIYEIGNLNSAHFIATEFVDGKTLRQMINEKPLKLSESLNVAIQVAGALTAAHAAGIVHRDIKPENIMIRADGYVKILDFGLAKLTDPQSTKSEPETSTLLQSKPGLVMGTVQYMSPEQARGKKVDGRADIWSLGIVLYELLTGKVPFSGETSSHVMVSLMEDEPPPLINRSNVPAELGRIVTKALRKNPQERYQTVSHLASDLKNLKDALLIENRLKEFLEAVPSSKERTTKNDGQAADVTRASVMSTVDIGVANTTSSAQYLIGEIKRHQRAFSVIAASLTIAVVVVGYFSFASKPRFAGSNRAIDSVAVLSFINESGNAETEYLADGISNSIISKLSPLPNLKVISFNSVLRYKGLPIDPQTVGQELNVRAVLVGRMARRGDALQISAELVDVHDNRRLWAKQYSSSMSEILVVQERIANEIAEKLRVRVDGAQLQVLRKPYTESKEAYDAYARGHQLLEKRTTQTTGKAIEYFQQAIKLDPNYALAYAELAYAHWSNRHYGSNESLQKAEEAVVKALEKDSTLAEAHTVLGHIRSSYWDWVGAEGAFRRGVELNSNSAFAHSNYAFYWVAMKRFDEAVAESARAVELEPSSVFYNRNVALNLYFARRYDEAIAQSQKTLELDPIMPTAHAWLAKSYQQKGLYDQAVEAYIKDLFHDSGPEREGALRRTYTTSGWKGFWRQALDFKLMEAKERRVHFYGFAEIYAQLGEKDQVFAWLEKSYEERELTTNFVVADPLWDDLRSDPRYIKLVRRMGLTP